MVTCPRCGAENLPTTSICRVCLTQLEVSSTVSTPVNAMAKFSQNPDELDEVLCVVCNGVNDSSWAFCQQCGVPLKGNTSSLEKPIQPVASQAQPTVVTQNPAAAPPTIVSQPAVKASDFKSPINQSTPAMHNTVQSQDVGIICTNCSRVNQSGSSFCAACGLPLQVERTLVMSAQSPKTVAKLRLIQEGGNEGEVYKIESDELTIGRNAGDIRFPHDGYMSGKHARIVRRGDEFFLLDNNSRNGTFKKIDEEVKLKQGDVILVGKQLFRFEI